MLQGQYSRHHNRAIHCKLQTEKLPLFWRKINLIFFYQITKTMFLAEAGEGLVAEAFPETDYGVGFTSSVGPPRRVTNVSGSLSPELCSTTHVLEPTRRSESSLGTTQQWSRTSYSISRVSNYLPVKHLQLELKTWLPGTGLDTDLQRWGPPRGTKIPM